MRKKLKPNRHTRRKKTRHLEKPWIKTCLDFITQAGPRVINTVLKLWDTFGE